MRIMGLFKKKSDWYKGGLIALSLLFISELFLMNSDADAASNWIKKILNHANNTGSHLQTAELLRIRGLTEIAMGETDEVAEESFRQALELSKKQEAKTYELRAADRAL